MWICFGNSLLWGWSGSASDWSGNGSILDSNPPSSIPPLLGGFTTGPNTGDGDTAFAYGSTSFTPTNQIGIGLTEQVSDNLVKDVYNVGIGFFGGQTSGTFSYYITTTEEALNLASLDTVVTGPGAGSVTEQIYSALNGTLLLTLFSNNSVPDPVSGLTSFTGLQSLYVVDTINLGVDPASIPNGLGAIQDIHNNFASVQIPEPTILVLLGIGFAAIGFGNRKPL